MIYLSKFLWRLGQSRPLGVSVLVALLTGCGTELQENTHGYAEGDSPAGTLLVITPKSVTAETGQKIQLIAHHSLHSSPARFQRFADPNLLVEWTASGGTISASGEFRATAPGTYKVVGKTRGRRKTDTSTVVVVDPQPGIVALIVSPDTAKIATETSRTFTAKAILADGSLTPVGVTWTANGGTIDPGGVYVAGPVAGRFHAIATGVSSALADTTTIVIEESAVPPRPVVQVLRLSPDNSALLSGQTQQFVVEAQLSDGTTSPIAVAYTATGGTVDSMGLFTAGSTAGTFRVLATSDGGLADTSRVVISVPQLGTTIYPGQSIQAAVNAFPDGTAFLLKTGVHRLQQVSPRNGNKFTGEPGAILVGAALLTAFEAEGGYWTASGQTAQGEIRLVGACQASAPRCIYPEQLFINDVPLQHVSSLSAVGAGKWYFDYGADKIYFADDPRGKKVELSTSPYAFYSKATNVTIEGLVVEKYASPTQLGAIGFSGPGSGWTVRGNEVRWNHGGGIRPGNGMQILSNNVHHQGQIGIAGSGRGVLVENNEIAHNNTAGFGSGRQGEAGGTKFTFTHDLVVRRNYSHDNHGPGLWTDINNINCLYEGNRVEDNDWRGIFHEVSYACVIRNNIVRRNGFAIPGAMGVLDGAGIIISNSPNVEVYGNTVEDNRGGIAGIESDRGSGNQGAWNITNLYVHDNTVRQTDTHRAGGIVDSDPNADPYAVAANNRWANNTYIIGDGTRWRWANNADLSLSQWRSYGQDSGSNFR
jgi:parallel beta-helix repeat protein